ncbi:MAG: WecB/TagA/CpsF family glycosyltransferase [Clostridia bacterium]|nr:WecB/TagA/CpsF family glycosyltransferase [Clostridia bacterium]
MEKIEFLNTYVNAYSMQDCLQDIQNRIETGKKSYLVSVNVDVVVKMEKDPLLKEITDNADIVTIDGKPLIWIAKKHKKPITEKISGSDLVPKLCEVAGQKGYTVFILGGAEGVAEQAKANLENKIENIKIVGTCAPPVGFDADDTQTAQVIEQINQASPDILLLCLGCPKQEKFLYANWDKLNAKMSVCAGATVDFLSGRIKRAPKWMSNHGLEWLYRFFKEPKRLFKRYFIDDMKIFTIARKYKPKKK